MLQTHFQFENLFGSVYRQGNVCFTPDGDKVISPVGNRVSLFDLVNNKSRTLPHENSKNIVRLALNAQATLLLSVDEDGRAILVNFQRMTVLHRINFKHKVSDVQFSPDGKFLAVALGNRVQVWRTPSHLARDFAPFSLHRTYVGHSGEVTSITWTKDSLAFATASKDMTCRLFRLYAYKHVPKYRPKILAGHRGPILNCFFSENEDYLYTVSQDGAVYVWSFDASDSSSSSESDSDHEDVPKVYPEKPGQLDPNTVPIPEATTKHWTIQARHYFNQASVTCTTFHRKSSLLIVGFENGVFGLWEMPSFSNIHALTVSQERVTSVAINASGEWLAIGASRLGQLVVWEWASESYVLKQQGHYFDTNTVAYSPSGRVICTGGDDGKVKLWQAESGFSFVTFAEHSSSITSVAFAKAGQIVFSASLDGTIRAYDLIRYRNFRTFTTPTPVQFNAVAVDPSGEVVAGAGWGDAFEAYVWSVQTGKLADVLPGHEAPISAVAFSPNGDGLLVTVSWDGTARFWNLYARSGSRVGEPVQLHSDALAVSYRPNGEHVAIATLNGQIQIVSVQDQTVVNIIDAKLDLQGQRSRAAQMRAVASSKSTGSTASAGGNAFVTLAYTPDGSAILAGGQSPSVFMYSADEGLLLRTFALCHNLSLDGVMSYLDNRKDGLPELDDDEADLHNVDGVQRRQLSLPGVRSGDLSKRRTRRAIAAHSLDFAPSGRQFAVATTEGLVQYSLDSLAVDDFDPFDLDVDVTPEAVQQLIAAGDSLVALVTAIRLSEEDVIRHAYESVPPARIPVLVESLSPKYAMETLVYISRELAPARRSPHVQFHLLWLSALLKSHGTALKSLSKDHAPALRAAQQGMSDWYSNILAMYDGNKYAMRVIVDQARDTEDDVDMIL